MAKHHGNSAQHPVEGSSSNVPKGSLSRNAKTGISIAAVIIFLLLITFGYYAIQEWRRARKEQDDISWNTVARKTLNAAVCLWIVVPIIRCLKQRRAVKNGAKS